MRAALTVGAIGAALASIPVARADEVDSPPIMVTAPAFPGRVLPPSVTLGPDALLDRQPRSIAEALRGLPGVSARTNSRGETIARIRGAEERQTQVFLDGAPLSVPWDGRVDLGILPAGLVGEVQVVKGAVPIEYGTNAVAGVVDLRTRRGGAAGSGFTGIAEFGTLDLTNIAGVATTDIGPTDLTLAGGYIARDAEPVADLDDLPFSQADSNRRTNSDLESTSFFAAAGTAVGPVTARVSLLHNETERGIAPESDRDPAVAAPRYWRYPDIRLTQLTVSAAGEPLDGIMLRAVGWRQWFAQTIDAYRNAAYAALRSRQEDEDDTLGGRLTVAHPVGPISLRWSASAQTSTHEQVDTPFPSAEPGRRLRYRQNLYSLGVEADAPIADATRVTASLAYDRATTPLTGDKPDQPALDALAFSAAVRQQLDDRWTLTLSGGRRTRFPTARELFGEALGRFLINPDLAPETAWLADVELAYATPTLTLTLNPFLTRGEDTLSQRVVRVNGQSLRQRFNLDGSTSFGIDTTLVARLTGRLTFELYGSALSARADKGDTPFRRLVQRPDYEIGAALDYLIPNWIDVRAELRRTGQAVDLDAEGDRAVLPAATEVNLRGSLPIIRFAQGTRLSVTAAVDNLTNATVLPQLGLPLPGRTLRFGVRLD